MKNTIEKRREKLVQAKLNSVIRRTGGNIQLVKQENGSLFPVELDGEILAKALIKLFEAMIHENHKRAEAENIIAGHYSFCLSKKETLTTHGAEFMNALVESLAELAAEKQEGK